MKIEHLYEQLSEWSGTDLQNLLHRFESYIAFIHRGRVKLDIYKSHMSHKHIIMGSTPMTTTNDKIRSSRTESTVRWLATSEVTLILKISPTEPCIVKRTNSNIFVQ